MFNKKELKKVMKKIKWLALTFTLLFVFPILVLASSGKITVSGTSTVVVGNSVKLTVTLSGSDIGSWKMNLNYDKSFLKLTATNSESGGTMMSASSTSGLSKKTYSFTFTTLKQGSTTVSVNSYEAYNFSDFGAMSLSASGKTIKIITKEELEASYSKNNNLASLGVDGYELSPAFNQDTLEYNVIVPEDTKEINISGKASDGKSTVTGLGVHPVTLGTNTFPIVVRAENGSEKSYTLTVEVKDANPINVKVGEEDYTVVKIKEYLPVNNLYQDYNVTINDINIPAYYNEFTKLILVGLKDKAGKINLFIYDEDAKTYTKYNEIGLNKVTIYPKETKETLEGYKKTQVTIGDLKVDAYYLTSDERFVNIYGVNVETGEEGFFVYDKKSQSLTKYNDEYDIEIKNLNTKLDTYVYIIIGFSVILVLLLFIMVFIIVKKQKKPRKKENEKNNKNKKNEKIKSDDKK